VKKISDYERIDNDTLTKLNALIIAVAALKRNVDNSEGVASASANRDGNTGSLSVRPLAAKR
jgi:hypothetical protein